MITLQQIQAAHAKVRSGADFPAYIHELKALGVCAYETFVADGHTVFKTPGQVELVSKAKYDTLAIATTLHADEFIKDLKAHQQGSSDYTTFCAQCAAHGIEKWEVDVAELTCTYFSLDGTAVWVEKIPG